MTKTKMTLPDKLDSIANGNAFYAASLYEALDHPATTKNDSQMLMRYMYGAELTADRLRLQELTIHIREYDNQNPEVKI